MASLDEERYLRHIWLLGEGGLFVLRGVVLREATKSGSTLESHLQNGRGRFNDVLKEQQHCLFPTPTTVNADIYTWDMSLIFVVLKRLFWKGLSLSERVSLSALKTYRNDFQGHPTQLSMNASDYSSNRQLLEQALRQIASGINGNATIDSVIKRTALGRIDSNSIFTHIKDIYDFRSSFLTAVEDMLQRVNSQFSSIQGDLELVLQKLTDLQTKHLQQEKLRKTKHKYSRELKIIIQAECDNEEKQRKANDLLFKFVEIIRSDTAIRSDEIRRIITQRVEWYGEITLELLDDLIEWFNDIEDLSDGVGKPLIGSIILPISCSSVTGILTLLKYMNDRQSKKRLSRISSTVSALLGFPCSLSWKVEPMSLRSALSSSLLSPEKEKRSKDEKDLVLPIHVTNIEQLTYIWNMFGEAERSSNMEKISAILSLIFGETIRLKTYVDNNQLRGIVYERGTIESQPDKSTDDQSSDKEHKKQIQRKFGSSDSDEDSLSMTDVSEVHGISKKEEVNWVKSVLALEITAEEAMTYLARSIFKQFFNSLNFNEKINFENLLDIAQSRHKDYILLRVKDNRVWVVNSPGYRSLLEKLVSAHWDPAYVEWDNIGDTNVERYWKIAKLYMPHGNKDSTCPEDTNMIAIFHMLRNFKVKDFVEERKEIDKMIRHVNYLLHTPENKISQRKMSTILKNIYQFMKSTKLSEDIKSKTKDKLQKVQLISNCDEWYKRILPNQKSDLAFEQDETNQFLNITEKLLVEFTKETRYTMEPEYNEPLSDKIKGETTGRDVGAIGGPVSLLYGSTLGATASGTTYIWKSFNENPPSQSSDEVHTRRMQSRYSLPDIDEGFIEIQPALLTDDQSSDKEHKKQIRRKFSSSAYDEEGHIDSDPDNSTDDQSCDEKHKKQIQRNFSLSDSDEAGHIDSHPDNSTGDQSCDEKHKKQIQRKYSVSYSDEEGHIDSDPDNSTDDQSCDEKQKKQIQRNFSLSDSDEADHIDSHPDNSTGDQSCDEKHKKQIQRKYSVSYSDEDVWKVQGISKKEDVHWVKSVLALKITADDAMIYLARSIFKKFFKRLSSTEKKNLQNLLDIAHYSHMRRGKDHRVWVVNSPECESLLEKLVAAQTDPLRIEWGNIGDVNVKSYWKIAKLYMPYGNKDNTCPEDTDMFALFHLLRNFRVDNFEKDDIDQMIIHRSYLYHSFDEGISEVKMNKIFENIYKFMENLKFDEDIKSKTKDKIEKLQKLSNFDVWYQSILQELESEFAFEQDIPVPLLNITKVLLGGSKVDNYSKERLALFEEIQELLKLIDVDLRSERMQFENKGSNF